jgi:Right handed beta helix region
MSRTRNFFRSLFAPTRRVPMASGRLRRKLSLQPLEARDVPATFTVASLGAYGFGSGLSGDLRYCVDAANSTLGADTINFNLPSGGTITLGSPLSITGSLQIDGPAAQNITISGNNVTRLFNTVGANLATVSFSRLTLTGGHVNTTGSSDQVGGAVQADNQTLNFTDCILTGNYGGYDGGAIAFRTTSLGRLNLLRCSLTGNSASQHGGAIAFTDGGGATIDSSTFSGNTAGGGGGLSFHHTIATAVIRNSTFAKNTAESGGAIQLYYSTGTLVVQNSTIADNTATSGWGGGIEDFNTADDNVISLESSIVARNDCLVSNRDDLSTECLVTAKFSAIGTNAGAGAYQADATTWALEGQNLKLGPLADNGGPVLTMLPGIGSPLRDNGSNPAGLTTDQCGQPRAFNARADIGAVERPTFVVSNDADAGAGSLRQQVLDANAVPGANTITFDANAFATTDKTITLTSGEIAITEDISITGPGATAATVSGNNVSRIFNTSTAPFGDFFFSGLTLTGGKSTDVGGAVFAAGQDLRFGDCVITGNNAAADGGAIAFAASSTAGLTLSRCSVTGNAAGSVGSDGGAIYFFNGGGFTINDSTISGNKASGGGGGGIYFFGTATTAVIRDSTFANNSAARGGAIELMNFSGTLVVQYTTITGNTATSGSGGGIERHSGTGNISLDSTIVAANVATANANEDLFTTGNVTANLCAIGTINGVSAISADDTTYQLLGRDFKLGPLANYGGAMQTIPLLPGSPAINQGASTWIVDQRGQPRNAAGGVDIGAFESQGFTLAVQSGSPQNSWVNVAFANPLVATVTAVNAMEPVDGGMVTFTAPVSGASATPQTQNVIVNAGVASSGTLTANGSVGPYNVTATVGGSSVNFALANFIETPSLVVTTDLDVVANDNLTSLREAINYANSHAGADTISFGSLFNSGAMITLGGTQLPTLTDKSGATTIAGPGASMLIINGNKLSRVFEIATGATASIGGVAITGGKTAGFGGGVFNQGTLTVFNSTLSLNSSTSGGGGIANDGKLSVTNSTLSGNSGNGGGIFSTGGLTVNDSTLSGNTGNNGGAFNCSGTATLTGLTLSGNSAVNGGGIACAGPLTLNNSTLSGNSASGNGGGIVNVYYGVLTLNNTTLSGNSANAGGGISNTDGGAVTVTNTLFAANKAAAGKDVNGAAKVNFSLLSDTAGIAFMSGSASNIINATPLLGTLGNYGGPTQTIPLLPGSLAINAGTATGAPATDQRGRSRFGNVDIGAFEVQPGAKVTSVVVGDGTAQRSMVNQLTVTFDSPATFVGASTAAFTLTRQSDSKAVNLAVAMDPTNKIATLTFTGGAVDNKSLADGRYTLTVLAGQVSADGLDGNGDGTPGDNYLLVGNTSASPRLFRYFGDANGDGAVAANDFVGFRGAFGAVLNSSNAFFDFDGDGAISASDFVQFKQRYNTSI